MSFTQTIEVRTDDEDALHELLRSWHMTQAGVAPGYEGVRILGDEDDPGRYFIEVDFSSAEEAKANNGREETEAWAARLTALAQGEPRYTNTRLVCSSYQMAG